MESKIVLDGRFRITSDGDIFKISNGAEMPAHICRSGLGGYKVISYMDAGKQKHVYVHRLIAETFVPNPNHYKQVFFVDQNHENTAANNLQWILAPSCMNVVKPKMIEGIIKNAQPCQICGEITMSKTGTCKKCKAHLLSETKRAEKEDAAIRVFSKIDQSRLSSCEKVYVQAILSGMTCAEIAQEHGVSRQCVDQALKSAQSKAGLINRSGLSASEKHRLKARIDRNLAKEKKLKTELTTIRDAVKNDKRMLELSV